jgi:hypothetical protein
MTALNPDVFAGDVLRNEYRRQMDIYAAKAKHAESLREELERVEASMRTSEERATSLMQTLAKYGGMLPPTEARNP